MLELIIILRRIYRANIMNYSNLVAHEIEIICEENGIDLTLIHKNNAEFQSIVNQNLLEHYIN